MQESAIFHKMNNRKSRFLQNKQTRFLRNKKANLAVTLLVIMTIVIVVLTLFVFLTGQEKIVKRISYSSILGIVYGKEKVIRYGIDRALETYLIKHYSDAVKNKEYIDSSCSGEFCKVSENVEEQLRIKIKNDFKNNIQYFLEDDRDEHGPFDLLIDRYINKGSFEILLQGNILGFEIRAANPFRIQGRVYEDERVVTARFAWVLFPIAWEDIPFSVMQSSSLADIDVKVDLIDLGLLSFQDVFEKAKECISKPEQEIQNCMNQELGIFDSKLEKSGDGYNIELETKKHFLIDNDFQKIKFNFFMRKTL